MGEGHEHFAHLPALPREADLRAASDAARALALDALGALDGIKRNLSDEPAAEQLLLDCKRDHIKYTESVTDDEYKARERFSFTQMHSCALLRSCV